jgi:hypothetical protein
MLPVSLLLLPPGFVLGSQGPSRREGSGKVYGTYALDAANAANVTVQYFVVKISSLFMYGRAKYLDVLASGIETSAHFYE